MTTMSGKTQAQMDTEAQIEQAKHTVATNQSYLDSTDWHASYSVETGVPIDATVKQNRVAARAAITAARQVLAKLGAT